jgi:hypothetical protein
VGLLILSLACRDDVSSHLEESNGHRGLRNAASARSDTGTGQGSGKQGPTFDVRRIDEGGFVVTVLNGSSVELIASHGTRLAPILRDGRVVGLRLLGDLQGELAGALGLEPGDVVLEINGVPLDDSQRLLESREVMFGAMSTTIRYRRDASERSVRYDLQRAPRRVEP